jgi:drug/metabolite transporter (DMT)-like permease
LWPSPGGQLRYFIAIESIPIGLAVLLEYLGVVLYAWLLLGQMPSPAELTGSALMLTGVILIRADDTRRSALA